MAPLPEILRLNGYSTAQFGKCHEVPVWEASPVGPFDRWPTGSGFEYFYGFVAGETNQWYPSIHEGTKAVEPTKTPDEGYHFMEDMTDRAIAWVRQQRLLAGDKPFFMYFAPGATHAPHHVPKDWADKYKGKFDQGWDKLREETFARQKAARRDSSRTVSSPLARRRFRRGILKRPNFNAYSRAKWKCTPASFHLPTITSGASSTRSIKSRRSTTR